MIKKKKNSCTVTCTIKSEKCGFAAGILREGLGMRRMRSCQEDPGKKKEAPGTRLEAGAREGITLATKASHGGTRLTGQSESSYVSLPLELKQGNYFLQPSNL